MQDHVGDFLKLQKSTCAAGGDEQVETDHADIERLSQNHRVKKVKNPTSTYTQGRDQFLLTIHNAKNRRPVR